MNFSRVGRLSAHILSLLVLVALWEATALIAASRRCPDRAPWRCVLAGR
jgi:hypothetical protein